MKKFFLDKKSDGFLDKLWVKKSIDFFLKSVNVEKGLLLDLGGGRSPYRELFRNKNIIYFCADLRLIPEADIVIDLNRKFPFKDKIADFVVLTQVLEHLPDSLFTLSEIYRILTPGGKFFITVPLFFRMHDIPNDFFRFTFYGLETLLKKSGFEKFNIWGHGDEFSILAESLNFAISSVHFPRKALLFVIGVINSIFSIRDKNKHLASNPERNYIGLSAIAEK